MEKKTERSNRINLEYPSVVFLGTPDFAVPALQMLIREGAQIKLVVTQPDRPKGRGKKIGSSPIKSLAESLSLPVYQPERIKISESLERILSYGSECAVVVAYGQLLPQQFLDMCPLGALNVHASLLPRYRGAAPIQRSILAGDKITGVSIMLLDAGMDTGPVLSQQPVTVLEQDNFGSLHDKLAQVGAKLLCGTLKQWRAGLIRPERQDDSAATLAPPIKKEELRLLWHLPMRQLLNTVRAFDPWPGAYAYYAEKRLKCFSASVLNWQVQAKPGEMLGLSEQGLAVMGGDAKALAIGDLQLEGQRRLTAEEFIRGHSLPPGSCLK
jgi:methionyl-tRNA formyltransferase